MKPEEVSAELAKVRAAIGGSKDVERFFRSVLHSAAVPMQDRLAKEAAATAQPQIAALTTRNTLQGKRRSSWITASQA
jgi:hypothetical protein